VLRPGFGGRQRSRARKKGKWFFVRGELGVMAGMKTWCRGARAGRL